MIKNIKMNDKLTFEQLPSAVGQLLEGFQNLQKEVSNINGLCQTIAETNARMDKKKSNDTEAMYLNVKEVSELLNCSKFAIYKWVQHRDIPHIKLGRRLVFIDKEVKDWYYSNESRRVYPEQDKHVRNQLKYVGTMD